MSKLKDWTELKIFWQVNLFIILHINCILATTFRSLSHNHLATYTGFQGKKSCAGMAGACLWLRPLNLYKVLPGWPVSLLFACSCTPSSNLQLGTGVRTWAQSDAKVQHWRDNQIVSEYWSGDELPTKSLALTEYPGLFTSSVGWHF